MNNLKMCDFINCNREATVSGHIYGHVRGSKNGDSFHPVNACEMHCKEDGLFLDKPIDKSK